MRLLHAGCGRETLPPWLAHCAETRLDIDPEAEPDIVASMTAMGDIGKYDAVYTSHAVEHLDADGVKVALREFLRVLEPGGMAVVIVPDTEDVQDTDEVLFESPAGPITGRDVIHGHAGLVATNPYMAHRSTFTSESLSHALAEAGFSSIQAARYPQYNLIAIGRKEST